MTRAERAAQAAELRKTGMLQREIADVMGISRTYAAELLNDPDGAAGRARKDSYRGTCLGCGARTDGSNGKNAAPTHCIACHWRLGLDQRKRWGRDEVIAAIQKWHDLYGATPSAMDWSPALARNSAATDLDRIEMRWARGDWPTLTSVRAYFGSWNNAIAAAGFTPRRAGGRARGDRANRWAA